ncbi:hypothetical protein Q3G72_006468 [Acer saccharum]|nr:hypothetical protein Q3G72_006468 [Acer saccharum]
MQWSFVPFVSSSIIAAISLGSSLPLAVQSAAVALSFRLWLNKGLVKGFLKNAKVMLKEGKGEIHVSHKEGDPYDKWELVNKAEKIGLIIHQVVPFCKQDYPGYHNKRAQGNNSDAPFPLGDCSTYKFRKLDQNGH